jgi:regulator of cell morphogenesis and NO signaling
VNKAATTTTIGDMVAADFRTAAVFERFGIDFCCGGGQGFEDACRSAGLDPAQVASALEALAPSDDPANDLTAWPIARLVDHIVAKHHTYVRTAMPLIRRFLARLVEAHGARHPELHRVAACFNLLCTDLEQHLFKEEMILFPYAKELALGANNGRHVPSPFGTVENPIRMMEREHRDAAEALRTIGELTDSFTPPQDGCTTYAVCMEELKRFEQDLHRHVHLENNVLFPKAIAIEQGQQGG